MTLDHRDIEILRMAAKYRWLPYKGLSQFGFGEALEYEIGILSAAGLIKVSRNKAYIRPSPQGYEVLLKHGYDYGAVSDRPYASASSLRRRLEVSSIMLTALRAGIDTLPDKVDALSGQPVFFPSFELRTGGANLMNAASCAGFGHWGSKGYMLQYVSPESHGMYLANELGHLHNLSSLFAFGLDTPLAMVFSGQSYNAIYSQLNGTASSRHGKHGFYDFGDVYRKSDIPIHLLSCDETGAVQLAVMRQAGYNARIAKAALGDSLTLYDGQIPEADGFVNGNPLVIAVDMDIRRVERICLRAKQLGRHEVMLAALKAQLESFYMPCFPKTCRIKLLSIMPPILDEAFGGGFSLYSMAGD